MARRGYPAEFRRRALDLVAAGKTVAEVARLLEVSDQSIYTWRRQEQIDRGELWFGPALVRAQYRSWRVVGVLLRVVAADRLDRLRVSESRLAEPRHTKDDPGRWNPAG